MSRVEEASESAVAAATGAAISVSDVLSDTAVHAARVKRSKVVESTCSSSSTSFSCVSSKVVEKSTRGEEEEEEEIRRRERPLLWKKRVTVNDWPCLEWNMQKWSSQLNEAIFTFRLYSLDTYFDDCTIHWENEPHATCFASLKHFAEWTSTLTSSVPSSPSSSSSSPSLSTPGDKSRPPPPPPPPPAPAPASATTCDQGHAEAQVASSFPPAAEAEAEAEAVSSPSCSLDHYDRTAFTAYTSYNHLAQTGDRADWSGGSLDWTRLGLGLKGDWRNSTLWIGTVGAYTPCHQDTYGYNAIVQVKGAKQWVLYRPSDRPYLYPCRLPYEESSVFSSVNILAPDLKRHPNFPLARPYIVTLEPGDVLIVPPKWFHFVQCVQGDETDGICMSLNAWQSIPSDRFDRLKESLVKLLATALIPTYEGLDNTRSLVSVPAATTTTTATTACVDYSCSPRPGGVVSSSPHRTLTTSWLNTTVGDPNSRGDVENAEDAFHFVRAAAAYNFTGGSREARTRGTQSSEQGHHLLSCSCFSCLFFPSSSSSSSSCSRACFNSHSSDEDPWMNLESFALQASSETLIWRLKDEKKTFLRTAQLHKSSHCEHEQGDPPQLRAQIVTKKRSREGDEEEEEEEEEEYYYHINDDASEHDEIIDSKIQSHSHLHSHPPLPVRRPCDMPTHSPLLSPHSRDLDVRTVIETILDDQVIEVIARKLLQEKGEREALTTAAAADPATTNTTTTTTAESQ